MFDAVLLATIREVPSQMAEAAPAISALIKANPLFTALVVGALLLGGGSGGRRRVSARFR